MIKSILIAVDGAEYTDPLMKYAIYLAKSFQTKLKIITVIDIRIFEWSVYLGVDGFAPVLPSSTYLDESKSLLQEKAEKVLEKCVEMVKTENVSYTASKHEGSPVEIISNQANIVDMIMLGARGEFAKWGRSKLMGATVEAISRECIKPLFISPKEFKPFKQILIPYDGSVNSNRALPFAGYFSTSFNAKANVFTVDSNFEIANNVLNAGQKYLESYEVEIHTKARSGNPEEEILKYADEKNVDLIVMGAYGHSRIKEAILGSTTERVMRDAKVPLLLVK